MQPVRPSRRVSLPAEALLTFAHKRRSIVLSWKVTRLFGAEIVCRALEFPTRQLANYAGQEGALIAPTIHKFLCKDSCTRRRNSACGGTAWMITASKTTDITQTSNFANSSNMGPLPQVSGFTFVVNP